MSDASTPLLHLADGRAVWLAPLTFGRARLHVGGPPPFHDEIYDGW